MNKREGKIFYHIYPLGFCGAQDKNNFNHQAIERLNKIYDWIPHMKYLGVTSLYLGPVFESTEHGYDTVDYFKVDRRLGTNENLKKLIGVLHENGIEVIFDAVFNHVGRENFAFQDVKYHKENSAYKNWFKGLRFDRNNLCNDGFDYETWDGHYNLVKLNVNNQEVKNYLFDAVRFWIDEFDIDGLRLDAADVLDFNFMRELSMLCKGIKSDFWLMGEVVHGDYSRWINDAKLDSVTNYECYKGLYSSHNDKNYFEIAYSLKRQFARGGMYNEMQLYNFVDNHDVDRIRTSVKNKAHLYPLYILLFSMPGIPSLYYGSEWAVEGKKGGHNDKQLRPALEMNYNSEEQDLAKHISNLSQIRKELNSLKYGTYEEKVVSSEQFIFERELGSEKVVVFLNSSDKTVEIQTDKLQAGNYIDLLNSNEIIDTNTVKEIKLFSCWGRILKKIC